MVDTGMTMQGLSMITIGILSLVVIYTIIPVVGSQLDIAITIPGNEYARSTLTLSGNVSCAELVNVTNNAGAKAVFAFNITTGGCPTTIPEYATVAVPALWNTSTIAAINLTTALNANATISGTMTATNPSAGVVKLTYNTIGVSGNGGTLAEGLTNGAWSSTQLVGGAAGSQWNSTTNPKIPTAVSFWEALGGIVKVGGVIVVVGGFLQTLRGLRG